MAEMLRVYPAYIKGSSEEVLGVHQKFLKIWAALECSRTKAINDVFEAGLEALAESEALEGRIDKKSFAIHKRWQQVAIRVTDHSKLEYIYEHDGIEKFTQFCQENGIDHEAFLANYRMRMPDSENKSKVIREWLKYTFADGEEYHTNDIREAAEIDGIVKNDTDWSLVKHIASTDGYSSGGKRGYWRKSLKVS